MPTYTWRCQKCGHELEWSMKISEYEQNKNNQPVCVEPGCDGNSKMEIQLQPVGAILKGSGWTKKG